MLYKFNYVLSWLKRRQFLFVITISLLFFTTLILLIGSPILKSLHSVYLLQTSEYNQIIDTSSSLDENTYINLNGKHSIRTENLHVDADMLMVQNNQAYTEIPTNRDKNFNLLQGLSSNEAFVSENIMNAYDFSLNDTFRVGPTTFTISDVLPSMEGFDQEYKRHGVIVLGYNHTLVDGDNRYLAFTTDPHGLVGVHNIWHKQDALNNAFNDIASASILLFLSAITFVIIIESLFQKHRVQDLRLIKNFGIKKNDLRKLIIKDITLKYVPSLIFGTILTMLVNWMYSTTVVFLWFIVIIVFILIVCTYGLYLSQLKRRRGIKWMT